ncbi:efflux RND transporter periplasmic adaptor subunit [Rubellimicrobium arenae]|uniref:efflux RND transporter periplasmic adaptor subunit n=1 Tax=Rubellimicrobium arenae TaxID=2817372 RepID=UPI001B3154D2|nr:efflux RND transporter periplasmic adaptor subunit [Rubellimicrobium arenae]
MSRFPSLLGRLAPLAAVLALLGAAPQVVRAQEAESSVRVPAVTVATAAPREFLQQVPVSGTLMPREEVLVFPETGGYAIQELTSEVGDRVEAGEVLARLDDRALRAQVAQAEAEFARAEAGVRQAESQVASAQATLTQASQTLERTQALRGSGTATQAQLDEVQATELTAEAQLQNAQNGVAVARAQLQQAQASLDVARLNLDNAQITAPVAGVISSRNGQVGGIASASGEPIYRLIRDGLVEVEAEVIETDLALVSVGDPAELRVAGLGTVPGEVRLISPTVNAQSRLGTVRITAEPRDGLRPGVFAGGWITVEQRQGLGVPATAVITDTDGSYILRVGEGGVLERRPVVPGLLWQDQFEIVDGLAPDELVVARAGAFFGEGDTIQPVRDDQAGGAAETGTAAGATAVGEARATEDGQ